MLTTTKEMMQKAYREGYAIPAINTQGGTYDIIRAICMAADELKSPIILAHYLNTGSYSGHDWFYNVCKWMAEKVSVPVAIHLDHGDSYDNCLKMLQIGFTSIMYDGSALPLEQNAANTEEIAKVCHAFGVPLEAELGELMRLDENGNATGSSNVVDPQNVKEYLKMCSPDFLALGIGNAHGFYSSRPNIRLDILEQCRSFTDIPFVLHGCTGMDDEQIKKSIELGVAKINFGTQIRTQYISHVKEGLSLGVDDGHAWKLSSYAENKLRDDIKEIIRLAGSEGKA